MVAGVVGTIALAGMSASQADPVNWAAAGVGFAAGAAVGAAAASTAYYNDPYYAEARYVPRAYSVPQYNYAPDAYAYAPRYPGYQYSPAEHGYDSNYIGPWKERQLEGRDY